MARSVEIRHFAHLLAALVVTAARASDRQLIEIHEVLEETFIDVFSLLSHDALNGAAERDLLRDLGASRRGERETSRA